MSTDSSATDGDSTEREIPEGVLAALRENGESDLFLDVIQVRESEVGVPNKPRREVLKYVEWATGNTEKSVLDYMSYGGGAFQSIREGRPSGLDNDNMRLVDYVRNGPRAEVVNTEKL